MKKLLLIGATDPNGAGLQADWRVCSQLRVPACSVVTAVTGVFALVAIGFVAVWSVLSNTLCSLILMVIRPFRVGDTIGFPPDDYRGKVVNFNMIFTTLETDDGMLLQVPNNTFFQRPIIRKKGSWHIGLQDQLYQRANASDERSDSRESKVESREAA